MYCINCGVKLADTEKICPLCGVVVFHPDLTQGEGQHLYPPHRDPAPQVNSRAVQIVLTTAFLIPILITLLCDLRFNRAITWSGYVTGGLITCYVLMLPMWFRRPNPVVFLPCDFLCIGAYLLYIDLVTEGSWFLSFALPVVGALGATVTAAVALLRYLRRGRLYIFGGTSVALGGFMLLVEFLLCITFPGVPFVGWSLFPLVILVLLGLMLIFLALCRPARETMERKFFL